jgi:hypothetical protein
MWADPVVDEYCYGVDVLTQIMAVRAVLRNVDEQDIACCCASDGRRRWTRQMHPTHSVVLQQAWLEPRK